MEALQSVEPHGHCVMLVWLLLIALSTPDYLECIPLIYNLESKSLIIGTQCNGICHERNELHPAVWQTKPALSLKLNASCYRVLHGLEPVAFQQLGDNNPENDVGHILSQALSGTKSEPPHIVPPGLRVEEVNHRYNVVSAKTKYLLILSAKMPGWIKL